jgi:hypothetical protein
MNNNFLKLRRGFDAAMRSKLSVAPIERPWLELDHAG